MINIRNSSEIEYLKALQETRFYGGKTLLERLENSIGIPKSDIRLNFKDTTKKDLEKYAEQTDLFNLTFKIKENFPKRWIETTKGFYQADKDSIILHTKSKGLTKKFDSLVKKLEIDDINIEFGEILESYSGKGTSFEGFTNLSKGYSGGKIELNFNNKTMHISY